MKKRSLSVLMVLCIILTLVTPVAAAPIPAPPPENCTVKYKEQTEGVTYEGYEKKMTYMWLRIRLSKTRLQTL